MALRWSVYLVRCRDGSLYAGVTNDLTARLASHNAGTGAKYTRSRRPVRLAYVEPARSRGAAQKREAEIKSWTRERKLDLVDQKHV